MSFTPNLQKPDAARFWKRVVTQIVFDDIVCKTPTQVSRALRDQGIQISSATLKRWMSDERRRLNRMG